MSLGTAVATVPATSFLQDGSLLRIGYDPFVHTPNIRVPFSEYMYFGRDQAGHIAGIAVVFQCTAYFELRIRRRDLNNYLVRPGTVIRRRGSEIRRRRRGIEIRPGY